MVKKNLNINMLRFCVGAGLGKKVYFQIVIVLVSQRKF